MNEKEQTAEVIHLRRETMKLFIHNLRNPLSLARTALGIIQMVPDYNPESDSGRSIK